MVRTESGRGCNVGSDTIEAEQSEDNFAKSHGQRQDKIHVNYRYPIFYRLHAYIHIPHINRRPLDIKHRVLDTWSSRPTPPKALCLLDNLLLRATPTLNGRGPLESIEELVEVAPAALTCQI